MAGAKTTAPTIDNRKRITDFFIDAPRVLNKQLLAWNGA
jgi:hypothetical protein